MLPNHGHPEIGAVLAAVTLRNRKTQMPRAVGETFHLANTSFPSVPRQPAVFEVGARPFPSMIEKADVVVRLLERLDLASDEAIEFVQIGDQVGRQCEIHGSSPR